LSPSTAAHSYFEGESRPEIALVWFVLEDPLSLAVKDLIDAGVHFGHRASRWNPKMKPYIYGRRNLIHIIDLKETVRGLLRSTKFFNRIAASNGLILFVGTKRQATDIIIEECRRASMPYVTERWLGGTLTNFRTIRNRLERLAELESILDGDQALSYSKKMISTLTRERRKIQRNLEGIRNMTRLPEALFVVDPRENRDRRSPQAGNQSRRSHGHGLRSRRCRSAHSGQ
jgi:small subunit ribosomal protein S2